MGLTRRSSGPFRFPIALVAALGFALSGCQIDLFEPKGAIATQEIQILVDSMAIMLAIVIPTILAIAAFAFWYRAGNTRAERRLDFIYSGRVELVVWSIPALTVLLLSGVIWIGSHQLDPALEVSGETEPLDVQVVSLDWKWLFIYPKQKIATVNELVVPVGAPLRMSLTSASVMDSFFVPQWGSMIYTMNGMTTRLNLRADVAGDYYGLSTHLSGEKFSDMHFAARAVSGEEFAAFVKQAAGGKPFDEAAYRELEKQGTAPVSAQPLAYDKLFEDIVSQKIAPAPGPKPGEGGY